MKIPTTNSRIHGEFFIYLTFCTHQNYKKRLSYNWLFSKVVSFRDLKTFFENPSFLEPWRWSHLGQWDKGTLVHMKTWVLCMRKQWTITCRMLFCPKFFTLQIWKGIEMCFACSNTCVEEENCGYKHLIHKNIKR